jgi:glycine/D-amino acid oxidase-like deaminating enzyme
MLPVLRDPDCYSYIREWGEGLCVGAFEPNARACFLKGIPNNFHHSLLPDDYDHFYPILEMAMEAIPAIEHTPIRTMVNGPESFTPDNQYILGWCLAISMHHH